jgi:hypothetical protein
MTFQRREITLTGGLGNQLFQLAATLSLFDQKNFVINCNLGVPRKNKRELPEIESFYIDFPMNWVKKPTGGLGKRLYGLGIRLAARNRQGVLERLKLNAYKVMYSLVKYLVGDSSSLPIIISRGVGFDKELPRKIQSGYLIGYFQTFRYLENYGVKKILMSLRPKEVSNVYAKIDNEMKASLNTILHIRLGDYRNESKIGMLNESYYDRALSVATHEMPDNVIWLFSDEPTQAIEMIGEDSRSKIRLINEELTTSETFELMRNGNYYIISNSTYSWWAASLSRRDSTKVVAPEPWFSGQDSPIDLIPPHWKSLDREQ